MDDIANLLQAWDVPRPAEVRRPARGTNNQVWLTRDYVLRIHHHSDAARLRSEHRLLESLSTLGLSFEVPSPIPTREGETLAQTELGFAALYRRLPGDHPPRTEAGLVLAGTALAELDAALAHLPIELAPTDWRRPLDAIHPAAPDLDELATVLLRELPDPQPARWFAQSAAPIEESVQHLRSRLPARIVHGDFAPSNLLMEAGRVTAVLDFELAGLDLRVAELAAALQLFTESPEQVAAFRRGYGNLSRPEEDALPTLILHRALGSVVWRFGHWRTGHSTIEEVAERLARAFALEQSVWGRQV